MQLDKEYYSIGEISKYTNIKQHVLRYWEREFRIIQPIRKWGGQRRYTKKDLDLIFKIKDLVYIEKYSIAGAKKEILRETREAKRKYKINIDNDSSAVEFARLIKKELSSLYKILK